MYACNGLTNFGYEGYKNSRETEMMYTVSCLKKKS